MKPTRAVPAARIREAFEALRQAVDRGECQPTREEIRAINRISRSRGIPSPVRPRPRRSV